MDRPFEQILVPLDGSPAAERALIPALELVRRTGVPLRVLARALSNEEEELAGYLADLADRYAGVTDLETQLVDVESIPDAITAGMEPGTLVSMSSHGRGRSEAILGSVTEVVLRTLGRPVLVVGPHFLGDAPLGQGRVVACLDGSPLSERTLEPARAWSKSLALPLRLAQVVPPDGHVDTRAAGHAVEGDHLASLGHRLGGVEGWDVLHDDEPARALARLGASGSVALLVLATHGRTGWDRLRLGSVAASTVQRATLPVLVVPAVEAQAPADR